jgi:hypothetical protein
VHTTIRPAGIGKPAIHQVTGSCDATSPIAALQRRVPLPQAYGRQCSVEGQGDNRDRTHRGGPAASHVDFRNVLAQCIGVAWEGQFSQLMFNALLSQDRPHHPQQAASDRTRFGSRFNDAKKASGIKVHLHDLRGTFATRCMIAKLTDQEIADILGWHTKDIAMIRVRYVDQARVVVAMAPRITAGRK